MKTLNSELGTELLTLVLEQLKKHGRYRIHGFGTFTLRTRKSRRIRNPITKELMRLPTTVSVLFQAAKGLKQKLTRHRKAQEALWLGDSATIDLEAGP